MAKGIKSGQLIIITGPSGVGKNSIAQGLLDIHPNLEKIVTETTRPRRPNETHGVDYHFRTLSEFKELEESGHYAEIMEYRPNDFKGTPRHYFDKLIIEEKSYLWLIDPIRATDFHTKLRLEVEMLEKIKAKTSVFYISVSQSSILWQRHQQRDPQADIKAFQDRFEKDQKEWEKYKSHFKNVIKNEGSISLAVEQISRILISGR